MANEATADSPAIAPARKGEEKKASGNLNVNQAAAALYARTQASEQAASKPSATPPTVAGETPLAEAAPTNVAAPADTSPTGPATEEAGNPAVATEAEGEAAPSNEAATEPEAEAEAVLSPDTTLSPEEAKKFISEAVRKRVSREVAKTKSIEAAFVEKERQLTARLAELEAKITTPEAQKPSGPVVLNPTVPLSHIQDESSLEQFEKVTSGTIRYAEEVLDTPELWRTKVIPLTDPETGEAVIDPQTGEAKVQRFKVTKLGDQEYTVAGLKQLMRQARADKEDNIPQRRKFLTERQRAQQVAYEKFPYLKDKNSPDYIQAQQAKRELPWLETQPNGDYLTGILLRGLKAMSEDEAKAKLQAAPKPKVAAPKPSSDQAAASAAPSANARVTPGTAARNGVAAERASVLAKRGISGSEAVASLKRLESLRNAR